MAGALEVSRLVSLIGPPGIGKTRLALAVAEGEPDLVVVVELAPVGNAALVPAALATALAVQEVPGQDLIETILATFRRRQLLLVLDNCEHLRAACAAAVGELLAGCPQARVLATSREPLGLDVEHVWPVPPLPVPPDGKAAPEPLMAYPAIALFVERADQVQPGFTLNAFVAADVAEICRRLEGIPLAIELAAARAGMLTPGEIVRRLEDRLSLLSDGGRSPVRRHRTLTAALDWSHALLSSPERVLLRRLSVFAGRFELEAARAICTDEEVDPPGVSELLVRLVSKSLVVAEAGPRHSGRVRYRLLETIRAFAGEKLAHAGEAAELRTAHAEFYVSLAERAEPELTGRRQEEWLERLAAERSNLRAALEWSLCHGQTELAFRLAGALVLFWRIRCHFSEGRDLLDAALAASRSEISALRAKALWGAGFLTLMAGDPKGAIPPLEESLAWFRELGEPQGCARALLILANARQYVEDPNVLALLEESVKLAREASDSWCLAHALGVAGFESARRDELRRARERFEECLAVARGAEDMQSLRIGLLGLGQVAVNQGDYGEAESLLEEAVRVTEALGEDYGKGLALRCLGTLALGQGDYPRALERLHGAQALLQELAPPAEKLVLHVLLANVAHAQGDRTRARRLLEEAQARGHGIAILQALGQLTVDEGDRAEAQRLFEQARALAEAHGKKIDIAKALHWLGQLARDEGDDERAAALHDEALELQRQNDELPAIAASLEAVAALAAAGGPDRRAAVLFGAAAALRARGGYARTAWEAARYEADTIVVRASLPAEQLAGAFDEGAALSLEQALAEASKGPRRTRPANGRRSLTRREQEVLELVAQRLTNDEIAERLVISVETVKTHVAHILAKLGVTGRRELAREVRLRNGGPR